MQMLWATDGSKAAEACIPYLRAFDAPDHRVVVTIVGPPALLSEARPDPARLLWHIVPGYRDQVEDHLTDLAVSETKRLSTMRAEVTSAARLGSPAVEVIDVALAEHSDLLLVGAHGHSTSRRMLLGSVSQQLATHAPCSVLVARRKRRPQRVLLGLDGSPESERALDLLLQIRPRAGDVAVVAHAVIDPQPIGHLHADAVEDARIQQLYASAIAGQQRAARGRVRSAARRLGRNGWITQTAVRRSDPVELLLDLQEVHEIELIAVGAHGERVRNEPLSADSLQLLQRAACSVLIAREHDSPSPRSLRR